MTCDIKRHVCAKFLTSNIKNDFTMKQQTACLHIIITI